MKLLRAFFLFLCAAAALPAQTPAKPNFLIILADDLGFSDTGSYGGEIETPNLDRLAANGLRFTQFYNTARCWPSRTALMTGYYPQQVRADPPSGRLPEWTRTLPQILKPLGYRCYHSGKWHVPGAPQPVKDAGFDRSFRLEDYDRNFNPKRTFLDDVLQPPVQPGSGFYSTVAYADHAIRCLKEHAVQFAGQPFFSYLAFTVPHFPLQALPKDIAKYRGRYQKGWDVFRTERFRRQKEMGIVDGVLSPMEPDIIAPSGTAEQLRLIGSGEIRQAFAWDSLTNEQRDLQAAKLAIHAAMVDRMDQEIGRVIEQIKAMGALEDTLILFLSDNGASAEMLVRGDGNDFAAAPGSAGSFLCLGPGGSTVCNTPFRRHKIWVHEGGIATPLIVHWPHGIKDRGALRHDPGHLIDLLPTLAELAGGSNAVVAGAPVLPGRSLVPALSRDGGIARDFLFFHHSGNRALRVGAWKIVSSGEGKNQWELYDLKNDRTETKDLATAQPDKVREMAARWQQLQDQFVQQAGPAPAELGKKEEPASVPFPFFAMDTAIRGTPEEVATTLADLGYAGLGGSGYKVAPMLKALEAKRLKLFNVYLTISLDSATAALTPEMKQLMDDLKDHGSALWLSISQVNKDGRKFPVSSPDGDEVAVTRLRELADYADPRGVKLALYPHIGAWIERCDDAMRVANKAGRPSIGATFNLCHFLKVEGDRDPLPVLKTALPRLFFVTINGADRGDTKQLGWDSLIQTLDRGDYNTVGFLQKLRAAGYTGPVGFQGYAIPGEPRENLARTIDAWRKITGTPLQTPDTGK
jgi:arylsulfatase